MNQWIQVESGYHKEVHLERSATSRKHIVRYDFDNFNDMESAGVTLG